MIRQQGSVAKVETYSKMAEANCGSGPEEYRGLPVLALPGLHGFVAGKVKEYLPAGSTLLDLGAGTGAMAQRLTDMGFAVTAMDLVHENFRPKDSISFVHGDLNGEFSPAVGNGFDGIVAVEIVEHLENPRKFLRECHSLLRDNGVLVLSIPNIDNPLSKAMFLRGGTFHWFTDYNYEKDGHISPIPGWLLGKMVEEAGFSVEWMGSYGDPLKGVKGIRLQMMVRLIRILSRTHGMEGEIAVAVLRK